MEFKGTKGKLVISTANQGETRNMAIKKSEELVTVETKEGTAIGIFGSKNNDVVKSNAQLFICSREMLEMLKLIRRRYNIQSECEREIDQLIKKATTI